MPGKLIVLEGGDGVGKATQTKLLADALKNGGYHIHQLSFPRYENDSSALVRMYLNGKFGTDPNAVNPYAASVFYSVDRVASYLDDWGEDYRKGSVILSDRYTTSNASFQTAKLPPDEVSNYLDWLYELEYGKLGLPKPDVVFYLSVAPETSEKMRRAREEATHTSADIHETLAFQKQARKNIQQVIEYSGWHVIQCDTNGQLRSMEDIHAEILRKTTTFLKTGQLE